MKQARRRRILALPLALLLALLPAISGAAPPSTLDRCLSVLAGSVFKLGDKWGRCVRACEDAKRQGELGPATRCSYPSDHAPTQNCLLRAAERLTGASSRARQVCRRSDVELFFGGTATCPGSNRTVDELLACLQDQVGVDLELAGRQIYNPIRQGVCGDGRIGQFEECDPGAFPNGCGFSDVCHPRFCFCTFAGCGNGLLEPGEDCDANAFPNGCSFDDFCDFSTCSCRSFGSATEAFLDTPESLAP
jgi:hypothetical protein